MNDQVVEDIKCYKCQSVLGFALGVKIGRREECPQCTAGLHCCRMCQFYDSSSYNECREPMANRVIEKDKANFCDFFKISSGGDSGPNQKSLQNAANALFKD